LRSVGASLGVACEHTQESGHRDDLVSRVTEELKAYIVRGEDLADIAVLTAAVGPAVGGHRANTPQYRPEVR
jgi:hypothetical protein